MVNLTNRKNVLVAESKDISPNNVEAKRKRKTLQNQLALLMDAKHTTLEDAWLIDSAATYHVCKHEEWFQDLKKIKPEPIGTVEAADYQDEKSLTAERVRDIKLHVKINYENYEVMLQNVYYAPKCRRNLMSVAQIEKNIRVQERFSSCHGWKNRSKDY